MLLLDYKNDSGHGGNVATVLSHIVTSEDIALTFEKRPPSVEANIPFFHFFIPLVQENEPKFWKIFFFPFISPLHCGLSNSAQTFLLRLSRRVAGANGKNKQLKNFNLVKLIKK